MAVAAIGTDGGSCNATLRPGLNVGSANATIGAMLNVSGVEGCCDRCVATVSCVAFVFHAPVHCFLKADAAGAHPKADNTAGTCRSGSNPTMCATLSGRAHLRMYRHLSSSSLLVCVFIPRYRAMERSLRGCLTTSCPVLAASRLCPCRRPTGPTGTDAPAARRAEVRAVPGAGSTGDRQRDRQGPQHKQRVRG